MGKELTKKRVFVGVSGGVDSSVSAALLKEQGYDVVGVFIRTWTPEFINCTWRDERRDAMRVCARLNIPFLECDAEEVYKKNVADYMIEEYKKGNTPNPDVMCNREVKFGVFWNFAKSHGADYLATGHYAQNLFHKNEFLLKKSIDVSKEQSYFLWTLTQDDLSHTLFPVGHLKKSKVRELAEKFGLLTAVKKDSQGICFLGQLDIKDFLKHYIKSKKGDVLNENGEIIGNHDGAVFFTLGERHGFTISKHSNENLPYYIVAKDINKNTITVANKIHTKQIGDKKEYPVKNVNWIASPQDSKEYTAQVRYHGEQLSCKIEVLENSVTVIFKNPVTISSGQSIVVYDGSICLGGGVVI